MKRGRVTYQPVQPKAGQLSVQGQPPIGKPWSLEKAQQSEDEAEGGSIEAGLQELREYQKGGAVKPILDWMESQFGKLSAKTGQAEGIYGPNTAAYMQELAKRGWNPRMPSGHYDQMVHMADTTSRFWEPEIGKEGLQELFDRYGLKLDSPLRTYRGATLSRESLPEAGSLLMKKKPQSLSMDPYTAAGFADPEGPYEAARSRIVASGQTPTPAMLDIIHHPGTTLLPQPVSGENEFLLPSGARGALMVGGTDPAMIRRWGQDQPNRFTSGAPPFPGMRITATHRPLWPGGDPLSGNDDYLTRTIGGSFADGGPVTRRGFLGLLGGLGAAVASAPKLLEELGKAVAEKPAVKEAVATDPNIAHHLTQAKDLLYNRGLPGQEHLRVEAGIPSRLDDITGAITHLKQVPGSEKAIDRMWNFRSTMAEPAGEFWDKPTSMFLRQGAAEHGIDELATQHGVPRILNPAEQAGGFLHQTPVLDNWVGEGWTPADVEKYYPDKPEAKWMSDLTQTKANFRDALRQHLQATGQTEHGILSDWALHGASDPQHPVSKLLEQHQFGDADLLGDELHAHIFPHD
jgi:hypothetical protein